MSCLLCFFFFKQKTAYEMRISDWSSDVCSSDLKLSLKKLRAMPQGLDLGALQSELPKRLCNKTRRLQCLNDALRGELRRYDVELAEQQAQAPRNGELRLIGRRHVRRNNSWMHNAQRLVTGKPRHQRSEEHT